MKRGGSDRFYLICAVVCFIGLAILGVFNAAEVDPDFYIYIANYYEGEKIDSLDPKTMYKALNAYQSTSTTSCIIQPKLIQSTKALHPYGQGMPWVVSADDMTVEEAEGYCTKGAGFTPYKDGQYIIAPGQVAFTNSNVSSNKDDITIEGTIGEDFKIRFEHVKEWWCHMDCSIEYSHTDVVGAGATNGTSKVNAGAIIGKATSGTAVMLYKKDGINWTPVSFEEFYRQ